MAYQTINQNSFMVKHWPEKHEEEEKAGEIWGESDELYYELI